MIMKKASFGKVVGLWLLVAAPVGNAEPPEIMVDTMIIDNELRLQLINVVAIGFERVVW